MPTLSDNLIKDLIMVLCFNLHSQFKSLNGYFKGIEPVLERN